MLVDMTLADVEGVIESKTDHATGLTVVVFDDERVSPSALVAAIESVGYEAEQLA
jgi:copper chaperone CopZ